MKKKVVSTIAAVLMVVFSGVAQNEFVVIEQGGRGKREKQIRLNDNIGVVKFCPTQMLVGEINFSYERQLSKQTSVEFGLGPTISNIAAGNVSGHYIDPWGGGYAYQTSGMGFFAEAGYRFYPLDETEALNRFYLGPVLKYRLKNFGLNDGAGQLSSMRGSDSQFSFALNFGYQLWMSKSFSMDFFTGLGIGYQEITSYYPEQIYVDPNWTYQWKDNSRSGARYVFNFGFKVGIGHE